MPKQLPADLLLRVKNALAEHPEGLALAELESHLQGSVSRRSLQRLIDQWLRRQAIRAEGQRRGRRYFNSVLVDSQVITSPTGQVVMASTPPAVQQSILVSNAGHHVQDIVRQSIVDRVPIGSERLFLERYIGSDLWLCRWDH